jgi:hypothetical protein
MADPLIPSSAADLVEKIGLTIATIIGLVYVLKWLSQMHLKALNDRITTLERVTREKEAIIEKREARIEAMQREHMDSVITYAHDLKSLVMQLLANDKANRDFLREHQVVVVGLFERLGNRPCQLPDYQPHPQQTKTPKPDLPKVPETDRIQGGRA